MVLKCCNEPCSFPKALSESLPNIIFTLYIMIHIKPYQLYYKMRVSDYSPLVYIVDTRHYSSARTIV